MHRFILVILIAFISCLSPVSAEVLVENAVQPEVTVVEFIRGDVPCRLERLASDDGVSFRILEKSGKVLLETDVLGPASGIFWAGSGSKPVSIAVKDIDGDKYPEVFLPIMMDDGNLFLYVYTYDRYKKIYRVVEFVDIKNNLTREFAVSDIFDSQGFNISLNGDVLEVAGKSYSIEEAPKMAKYFYEYKGGRFLFVSSESASPQDLGSQG